MSAPDQRIDEVMEMEAVKQAIFDTGILIRKADVRRIVEAIVRETAKRIGRDIAEARDRSEYRSDIFDVCVAEAWNWADPPLATLNERRM